MQRRQRYPRLTQERIKKFVDTIKPKIYSSTVPIEGIEVVSDEERIPFSEAVKREFRPTKVGEQMGPAWSTHWFRFALPAALPEGPLHLLFDCSCEACVFDAQGTALQGLTGTMAPGETPIRIEYPLPPACAGTVYYAEVAVNGLFGVPQHGGPSFFGDRSALGTLRRVEVARLDQRAWRLYHDLRVISELACALPEESPMAGRALVAGNDIVNCVLLNDSTTWANAVPIAEAFFATHNGDGAHRVVAVGHAHIDTAWLWPLAETHRKCTRTFSSALRLMEEYPDFTFACSQAVQYRWIKREHPRLFDAIKARIAEGRWIPVGGSWVEFDCQVPSGESMVRQFAYGQRLFRKHLGVTSSVFWAPDTFGFQAQIPQILRGCGIPYFLTQKLSWSQLSKLPAQSFLWRAPNGSRVLAHFPPADTYNAMASAEELVKQVRTHKDHDRAATSLLVYGYGDGGGGPTRGMCESLARLRDVDGVAKVEAKGDPHRFFEALEAGAFPASREHGAARFTEWEGELYLQLHRGTLTSQALVKKGNRLCERLLYHAELWSSLASLLVPEHTYPAKALRELWRTTLLHQFHDILPGSSIQEVYPVTHRDHRDVTAAATQHGMEGLAALLALDDGADAEGKEEGCGAEGAHGKEEGCAHEEGCGCGAGCAHAHDEGCGHAGELPAFAVVNPLPFARTEVIVLPGFPPRATVAEIPACGWATVGPETSIPAALLPSVSRTPEGLVLENTHLVARFDGASGRLVSLVHKATGREALAPQGARLVLYDDHPLMWDAWDIDAFHVEKPLAEQAPPSGAGAPPCASPAPSVLRSVPGRAVAEPALCPGVAGVIVQTELSAACRIVQRFSLAAAGEVLRCDVHAEWKESDACLKFEVPTALRPGYATFDSAFGATQRPTHRNTDWETGAFECCAHRYVDLSEPFFGVALLNDSKYGHSVWEGTTLAVTCLRAPKMPDPTCDQGGHHFALALYPHAGDVAHSTVQRQAVAHNHPLLPLELPPQCLPAPASFLACEPAHVEVDAIKRAEDSAELIVRLHEGAGAATRAVLTCNPRLGVTAAVAVLMNEGPITDPSLARTGDLSVLPGGRVEVGLAPWEVRTLRLACTGNTE